MRGYDERSYGDGFADVYDEWYADVTDVDATVARMLSLTGPGGRVLELGVGTGRLAVPMAAAGLLVVGVDSSAAMLDRLSERDVAKDVTGDVTTICGDMVDDLPDGPFDAALVAYNTIFNLLDETTQNRCFAEVAGRLRPGGTFVVEAFVPDADRRAGPTSDVSVRTLTVDHVVLSVSVDDPDNQRAEGQFVQFSESGGVRLRPWSIRWATPAQLDEMADRAGLTLVERFGDMAGAGFTDDSSQHVSIYVKPADPPRNVR
ncbi:MAG TPA: class I SAM-dependent methyltransferase [Ilumatobacteraceae bacterium]|nr:class I SAM-dependent methyltransferase [Ilumatobacteraceae bacterium]